MAAKNPINYTYIQEKKRMGEHVNMFMYSKAIVEEVKQKNPNYEKAEELFRELDSLKANVREDSKFYVADAHAYQRSISSLIRYAPTTERAMFYATFFYEKLERPFRTVPHELTVLINLLYVYANEGSSESMECGLSIIRLAISIGVFEIDPFEFIDRTSTGNKTFNEPLAVFESVAKKVLKYYNLMFSPDKKELVTFTK